MNKSENKKKEDAAFTYTFQRDAHKKKVICGIEIFVCERGLKRKELLTNTERRQKQGFDRLEEFKAKINVERNVREVKG